MSYAGCAFNFNFTLSWFYSNIFSNKRLTSTNSFEFDEFTFLLEMKIVVTMVSCELQYKVMLTSIIFYILYDFRPCFVL